MMKSIIASFRYAAALGLLCALVSIVHAQTAADPLRSWNDGPAKQAIMKFVAATTKEGSPDFVPAGARFTTFDQDGTFWGRAADLYATGIRTRPGRGAGAAASGMEDH
jgi:hypothetical protein